VYFRVHENSKVEVRRVNFTGNQHVTDQELREVMLTSRPAISSRRSPHRAPTARTSSSATYADSALLLRSWLHQRQSAEPHLELSADKRSLYISIAIDESEQYRIGSIEMKGDLLE